MEIENKMIIAEAKIEDEKMLELVNNFVTKVGRKINYCHFEDFFNNYFDHFCIIHYKKRNDNKIICCVIYPNENVYVQQLTIIEEIFYFGECYQSSMRPGIEQAKNFISQM
jgi:hypothetical protein